MLIDMVPVAKQLIILAAATLVLAKVEPKVKCTPDRMRIEVPVPQGKSLVYLRGLRDYPDPACRPHTDPTGKLAVLELDLDDVYRCAVTKLVNKKTGRVVYYQTLVIETSVKDDVQKDTEPKKSYENLYFKCAFDSLKNHTLQRRNVLPAGFQEPEELEITKTFTEKAPEPVLGVGVRQAGKLVMGELNVSPGTPLQMEIFLDKASAPIYGILVTHMQVTDTKSQEETIIYNGCSVDPYLFENFHTEDGDFLTAKFRAFKFPESTYVQFKGTVHVCLNKCQGVECPGGQIGYGRKRRAISTLPADPNKIFEITITSFIKVNYEDDSENFEEFLRNQTKLFGTNKLETGNQMQDTQIYQTVEEKSDNNLRKSIREEAKFTSIIGESSGNIGATSGNIGATSGSFVASSLIFAVGAAVRNSFL